MNFDLTEEQEMIVDAVSKFVANDSPVERFRKLRETAIGWEPSVWKSSRSRHFEGIRIIRVLDWRSAASPSSNPRGRIESEASDRDQNR